LICVGADTTAQQPVGCRLQLGPALVSETLVNGLCAATVASANDNTDDLIDAVRMVRSTVSQYHAPSRRLPERELPRIRTTCSPRRARAVRPNESPDPPRRSERRRIPAAAE
jgi:hypothetical protein